MTNKINSDEASLVNDHNKGKVKPEMIAPGMPFKTVLTTLGSLKLTVVLFAMAIFIVFAGTLAQVDKDIWVVIDKYFRTLFAWVEVRVFFPKSFFPEWPKIISFLPDLRESTLGFWFPGGWLIGSMIAINLVAANAFRFKIEANGKRLWAGLAIIAAGLGITWMVISSGANPGGVQSGEEAARIDWSTLWWIIKIGLSSLWIGIVFALLHIEWKGRIERWLLFMGLLILAGLLFYLFYGGDDARLNDSGMRILWQLLKGALAGLVLLSGCVMVFKKKAGIVLLHAGIALMMLNEVLVGTRAVEARMQIEEGQTVNFVRDMQSLELAVIDPSDPDRDYVAVFPIIENSKETELLHNKFIQDELLPFDIEIMKFMKNSRLRSLKKDDINLATKGEGLQWFAEEIRSASGAYLGGGVDMSSAYVKFIEKNRSEKLGTHLLSLLLSVQDMPEKVIVKDTEHGNKTYNVYLRFKRTYKPYSMQLIDVQKNDYMGTTIPKDYRSIVQLVDKKRNVDRQIHIWMNNPLRFAGETFYQSGYQLDKETGVETTTLAVVSNTGWMIPYVSCMIVATGMLAHFWILLLRFLKRRATGMSHAVKQTVETEQMAQAKISEKIGATSYRSNSSPDSNKGTYSAVFALIIVIFFAALIGGKTLLTLPSDDEMNLYEFGKLPLVYQGRVKPFDTLARNSLRIISDKQTFSDEDGKTQPAICWLLDVIAKTHKSFKYKVFRINNLEVLTMLGLERRKGFRYALNEFTDKLPELTKQANQARAVDPSQLSLYQKKILDLETRIGMFDLLIKSFALPQIRSDHVKEDLFREISQQQILVDRHPPLVIPPVSSDEKWQTYRTAVTKEWLLRNLKDKERNAATEFITRILLAYANDNAEVFNIEVEKYQDVLAIKPYNSHGLTKVNFEAFFNHFEPFYNSAVLYLVAFLLAALSWLGWSKHLNRASFWLIVFTFAVHSFALIARIYISGRPPVTNLYSSAVFIGWGCVLLGLILEIVYHIGIGNIIATISGFATLLIAHFLAGDGDTFTVLQAVLDTQFWLATHVVCVTLGYATTFVTGLLGIVYIFRGVLTPSLKPNVANDLIRMIYGTLCFAIFFSFVGTVLGGLWADDSWGRFWGWDPKENGALIIVLWNALVLHTRWGGMVKERGLAVLAVIGNIVTSWSWFGVNQLGVGLHSYGFTEGVLRTLGIFVVIQLAIITVGLMPKSIWWSFRQQQKLNESDA